MSAPLLLRNVRSSMLEVINLDYVRTARAKGVSEWLVIWHHALVNAALPLVTVAGLQFGLLLGGAIITETVFAVPGLGRLIVGAIRQLDFPIVQAGVFVLALAVVLVNFTVDLLYGPEPADPGALTPVSSARSPGRSTLPRPPPHPRGSGASSRGTRPRSPAR
jgi:ABC-type dipeptide/oligopeptide/nickel transport system permease component